MTPSSDPSGPPVLRLTLGTNNVYALPGAGGITLIDAGPDYEGAWEALLAALHTHAIAPSDVRSVILTHHHLDHAGLAARWQSAGAQILAARADAAALTLDAAARDEERTRIRREFFRHGVPPDVLSPLPDAVRSSSPAGTQPPPAGRDHPRSDSDHPGRGAIDRAPHRDPTDAAMLDLAPVDALTFPSAPYQDPPDAALASPTHDRQVADPDAPLASEPLSPPSAVRDGTPRTRRTARTAAAAVLEPERYTRWPSPLRMTAVHADRLLDGGACLTTSGRPLRVIAAPGHTPGTLLLLEPATGALFTGDHILPRMAPSSGFQFDTNGRRRPSLPAYLASLRASRALAVEARALYPGHGEPAEDLADAVDWTVRLLEQRARRTLTALRRGPATAYDLALRLFPHLRPHHLRASIAETVGLLDLLADRGLALAHETSDAVTWQALAQAPEPDVAVQPSTER